jgi:hypothetical protein
MRRVAESLKRLRNVVAYAFATFVMVQDAADRAHRAVAGRSHLGDHAAGVRARPVFKRWLLFHVASFLPELQAIGDRRATASMQSRRSLSGGLQTDY